MIEFKNVDKIYPNGFKALSDISCSIEQGEFIAVIGRSGAGKSTFIKTINKMIDINAGTLTVNGIDVSSLKGKKLRNYRKNIGMIFQFFNLVSRTTVLKNTLTAYVQDLNPVMAFLGIFPNKYKLKALESLDRVDILEKAFSRVDELSGGQQQRVALARTLAQNPEIILADEPVASLDPVTAREVMDYFKKINEESKISILINIHHVELGLEYSDRTIGLKDGIIVYDGPSKNVDEEVLALIYGDRLHEIKEA